MEISNSVKSFGVSIDSSGAAKAAESVDGRSNVAAESKSLEMKAPPAVKEFEPADVDKAIADLQKFVEGLGRSLSFRRDDTINRSIITVRDSTTNQLVRQIPAEEVVAIARDIRQDLEAKRAGMLLKGGA